MHWRKIALIGIGLLGGSLGLAIRQRRLADKVDGFVRRSATIAECTRLGVVDHATRNLDRAVADAELVILCTPIAQMLPLATAMLPHLSKQALVTDVGSVKASVVRELEPALSSVGARFAGSHPMAGAEKSGVTAARADLFEGAACVVTPTPRTAAHDLEEIETFWRSVGACPMRLSPDLHDELVSRSSHLPHIVATELVHDVLSPLHPKEQAQLCATGFRDTTRIASSSPEMWRDIVMANRSHLSRALDMYIEGLQEFRHLLDQGNAAAVEDYFARARQRRNDWQDSLTTKSTE